jgi:hypothetical protein
MVQFENTAATFVSKWKLPRRENETAYPHSQVTHILYVVMNRLIWSKAILVTGHEGP